MICSCEMWLEYKIVSRVTNMNDACVNTCFYKFCKFIFVSEDDLNKFKCTEAMYLTHLCLGLVTQQFYNNNARHKFTTFTKLNCGFLFLFFRHGKTVVTRLSFSPTHFSDAVPGILIITT